MFTLRIPRLEKAARFMVLLAVLGLVEAEGYALITVSDGESLGVIASRYQVAVEVLKEANGLADNTIFPGDILRVPLFDATGGIVEAAPEPPPGFTRHILGQGETLSALAELYEVTLTSLIGANPDLSSMDRLPAGIELLIPPDEGLLISYQTEAQLVELALAHAVDPVALIRANGLTSPLDLHEGMLLFLPGVEPTEALERLARVREEEHRYIWPLHGRITSYFGRRNLGMGILGFHRGLDVAAPSGTPVLTARSGTVVFAAWSSRGFGNLIKIRHQGGDESWYAHLSQFWVTVGEHVDQGEGIGRVGSTGLSTGPHLHLELHRQGRAFDPLTELR